MCLLHIFIQGELLQDPVLLYNSPLLLTDPYSFMQLHLSHFISLGVRQSLLGVSDHFIKIAAAVVVVVILLLFCEASLTIHFTNLYNKLSFEVSVPYEETIQLLQGLSGRYYLFIAKHSRVYG